MMTEPCWKCLGVGGWHDCGEDCCACLDPDDELGPYWIECDICDGLGELEEEEIGS
jgi:hypothetical protein